MQTLELITRFQTSIFEMSLNGLITDREFSVLESLTENMTKDVDALTLTTILTTDDLKNEDVVDCIVANQFTTALIITDKEWWNEGSGD